MNVLGLDVGGANLKAAHSGGAACLRPFALWKHPDGLADALREMLRGIPAHDLLAVTMTGELCDCYETKRQGVNAILDAVQAAAGPTPVRVWRTDGRLADVAEARATPLLTASANWLALATFAGRYAPAGPALLIDVGSTTTDIVPLLDGRPVPHGRTDRERLRCQELVYTGVQRTPLCALLWGPTAAELFATTRDAYLLLGLLPEAHADRDTADARPATTEAAHARLARMVGADAESFTLEEARELAATVVFRQGLLLTHAVAAVTARLPGSPGAAVLAGSGEFLARAVLENRRLVPRCPVVSLAERLGSEVSQAACAYALATLAAEREGR